jgi:hypothetical protein
VYELVNDEWVIRTNFLNGNVDVMRFGPDGDLYVGGDFTNTSPVSSAINRVARVTLPTTGTANFVALGAGVTQAIESIAFYSGDVVVGSNVGTFAPGVRV